jgi:transcriptional regulator with XRE-family HTH domain
MKNEVRAVAATCRECGGVLETRVASRERPYSFADLSGLQNVYLVGIKVSRCAACDTESPAIPRLGELNRVISRTLAQKTTPLIGSELRFLRKRAGISSKDFADLLLIDPSTLSRAENDKKPLGPQSNLLARAIAVAEIEGGEKTVELLLTKVKEHKAKTRKRHQLRFAGNRWTEAA